MLEIVVSRVMDTWVYLAAGGVFVFFIAVYVIIMLLWPEWVGITGKVALEAERSHRGGSAATEDAIDNLHKKN